MRNTFRLLPVFLSILVNVFFVDSARALSVTYSYVGNTFDEIDGESEIFSTSDRVTAQFTIDCAAAHSAGNCRYLPYIDYINLGAVDPKSLRFSAGPAHLPTTKGSVEISQLLFSTDSNGRIVDWDTDLFNSDPWINVDTDNIGEGTDSAAALGEGGNVTGEPGTWSFVANALPMLSPLELIVFGASIESDMNFPPTPIPLKDSPTWPHRVAENLGITGTMYGRPGASSSDMLDILRDEYLVDGPPISEGTIHIIGTLSDFGKWITEDGIDQTALDARIANTKTMVQLLTDNGAKHIYVTDQYYRGRTPQLYYWAQGQADPEAAFADASAIVNEYVLDGQNQIIDAALDINPDVHILRYGEFLEDLENHLSSWGFAEDGYLVCFNGARPGWECVGHPIYGQKGSAPDMTKLVFHDRVHTTARGHEVLAEFVSNVIRDDMAIPSILPKPDIETGPAKTATSADAKAIARLYSAAFDRKPKVDGLNFWVDSYEKGRTLVGIAKMLFNSPEFIAKYGALDDTQYVEQLFRNILEREGVVSGVVFWIKRLSTGTSRAKVLSEFAETRENIDKTDKTFADMRMEGGRWIFEGKPAPQPQPQPGPAPKGNMCGGLVPGSSSKFTLKQGEFAIREVRAPLYYSFSLLAFKTRFDRCPVGVCSEKTITRGTKDRQIELRFSTKVDTPPGTYNIEYIVYLGGRHCNFLFCVNAKDKIKKRWKYKLKVVECPI